MALPRLLRVPAVERGITLGDFLVPIRVGERASSRQRHLLMVIAGTLLIVLGARLRFYLPDNPVPITLQTFGVLFGAALLGFRRGIASVVLYLLLGLVGWPVFAAASTGTAAFATSSGSSLTLSPTGGYLVGFLVAAALVGRLAELGWDRHIPGSLAAMLLGNAIVYLVALPWLALSAHLPPETALQKGLLPFLPGDVLKLIGAGALLPLGWWLVRRRSNGDEPSPS